MKKAKLLGVLILIHIMAIFVIPIIAFTDEKNYDKIDKWRIWIAFTWLLEYYSNNSDK